MLAEIVCAMINAVLNESLVSLDQPLTSVSRKEKAAKAKDQPYL